MIQKAIDLGINFFDTADLYDRGANEITVGSALKTNRKKVVLATKVGNQLKPDGRGWDWNPHKDYIITAVEKSLERLQTDYIDLYQLHGGTIEDPIDETIEAFELLKQQGKILYYGISSIRPNVIREWVKRSHLVSVMMQYSLLDRRPEEECLNLLNHHNIGVLARGSIAKGLLVNKPADSFLDYSKDEVSDMKKGIDTIVNDKNKTAVALGYVLKNPAISAAVVGIRTADQLTDVVNSIHVPLTDQEYDRLAELPRNYYKEHR